VVKLRDLKPVRRPSWRSRLGGPDMTTLTLRRIKDDFVMSGPDIEEVRFRSIPPQKNSASKLGQITRPVADFASRYCPRGVP
jgi:hypothetical protein